MLVTGTDAGPAPLERTEVGDRGDLAVRALAGQPDLDVVGELGGEAGVAGREGDDAVGQVEFLQAGLGVADHLLHLGPGVGRSADADHLHLGELVLADQPAGVAPVRAGLGAETRCLCGQGDRQVRGRDDLVGVEVGERDLCGGDEEELALGDPGGEQVLLELGQLARARHGLAGDEERNGVLDVTVAAGVQVEHERDEGAFQGGADTAKDAEAWAGEFRGPPEVENAHALAQVHMVLRLEGEGGRVADTALLDGEVLGVTVGCLVGRQVRDGEEEPGQLLPDPLLLGLRLADLLRRDWRDSREERSRVWPRRARRRTASSPMSIRARASCIRGLSSGGFARKPKLASTDSFPRPDCVR